MVLMSRSEEKLNAVATEISELCTSHCCRMSRMFCFRGEVWQGESSHSCGLLRRAGHLHHDQRPAEGPRRGSPQ